MLTQIIIKYQDTVLVNSTILPGGFAPVPDIGDTIKIGDTFGIVEKRTFEYANDFTRVTIQTARL